MWDVVTGLVLPSPASEANGANNPALGQYFVNDLEQKKALQELREPSGVAADAKKAKNAEKALKEIQKKSNEHDQALQRKIDPIVPTVINPYIRRD